MAGKTRRHLETLREMRGRAVLGGGRKRIDQQHERFERHEAEQQKRVAIAAMEAQAVQGELQSQRDIEITRSQRQAEIWYVDDV